MNEYTFPFDTCETPNKHGVAQPYSMMVNIINCCIILYFLLKTKKIYTFILLFSILCFELFHTFSHIIHISGTLQINITHSLVYVMNLAFFYVFYSYTQVFPSLIFIFYILLLIMFDIYSVMNLSIIYYLITQSLIFISLLFYYYHLLPKYIQKSIYIIFTLIIIIIFLFLNEKYNCKAMLSLYPNFPFHILIELTGLILFYVISSNFYKL